MDAAVEEVGCLVPVARKKAEVALEAQLPGLEGPERPPRVNLERANELVRHNTKWGEVGADFLKHVFFDPDGQPRSVVLQDVLQHCLSMETTESAGVVRDSAVRFVEALEASGLLVSVKSPIMHTRYSLNPTPGVVDLLEAPTPIGFKVLEKIERTFEPQRATEFLAERIGAPCKAGTTCADLAARLQDRVFLSTILKDSSLYVEGNHQGFPLRSKISFYLNEGINAGVVKFERLLKDGEEWEVYSLTDHGKRFVGSV